MYFIDRFIAEQRSLMCVKIGKIFQEARKELGWTGEEGSQASGFSKKRISLIEQGTTNSHSFNLLSLTRLAACYGKQLRGELKDISEEDYKNLKEPLLKMLLKKSRQ